MAWSSLHTFTSLVMGPWVVEVQVLVPHPGKDRRDTILFTGLIHPHIPAENGDCTKDWWTLAPKTTDGRLAGWRLLVSMVTSPPPSNAAQCAIQTIKVRLERLPLSPRGFVGNSIHAQEVAGEQHEEAASSDHQEPRPIAIQSFKVSLAPSSPSNIAINLDGKSSFANGFQSWTKSQAGQDANSVFEKPNWFYNQITHLGLASDMDIYEYSGQRGLVHSHVWTILRDKANTLQQHAHGESSEQPSPHLRRPGELVFCGSLSENLGYTYFIVDHVANTLTIYQDVKGRLLHEQRDSLELKTFFAWGDNDAKVWDEYADAWKSTLGDRRVIKDSVHEQVSGWTSWYLHYENINEAVILENLGHFTSAKSDSTRSEWPAKVLQIDDGYTIVGDWLDVDTTKFPHGMKHIAHQIRQHGLMPGLWMAPFCASKKSKIVRDHPDWFIHWPEGEAEQFWNPFSCCRPRDSNASKMMLAHPAFHAGAVALDLENRHVRDHLANVFRTVTQDWGFQILKLDFLFAAAQVPRNGKTRGQLMWEAMQMVRDWAGSDTLLLGCGVPLGSAMMLTDYCRIGCDVGAVWDSPQRFFHDREYISTFNSLTDTLARWGLSGRFFGNDPDVYFTRTWSMGLTRQERLTLMSLNHLLGHLVFTSDPMDVQTMDGDQKWMLSLFHPWPSMPGYSSMPASRIIRIIQPLVDQKDVYLVHVEWQGRIFIVAVNLTSRQQQICLNVLDQMIARDHGEEIRTAVITGGKGRHASIYFHSVLGLFGAASSAYTLQKRETVVFVRVKDSQGQMCLAPPPSRHHHHHPAQPWMDTAMSQLTVLTTRCGHFLPMAEIAAVEGDQIHLHPLPASLTRSTQVWLARPIQSDRGNGSGVSNRMSIKDQSSSTLAEPWMVNGKEVQLEPSCRAWAGPSYEIGSVWI